MKPKTFMQLSFNYTFQELNDEVFCAYTVPYTHSAVLAHLKQLKLLSTGIAKFTNIGSSLGGIDISLIKISNNFSSLKPIVVLIGRQHPGETHSSFIIHGFINHLLSTNPLAIKFRDYFETWIIPVINPDGVICGNYRSNLQGKDMNRCFYQDDDPQAKSKCHEVELLTNKIKKTFEQRKFRMFLDIHSHSS
jgi:cytosolic carboxypeptidase protein 2/3